MAAGYQSHGMGWIRDYPDYRDLSTKQERISVLLERANLADVADASLPTQHDLTEWFPDIDDQGNIQSSTAFAAISLASYLEKRAVGREIKASKLFLYKATRNLLQWTGDTGAFLRTAMAAMLLFGVPPEKYWPYKEEKYDEEPPAFCYAFARSYSAIRYYRLDPPGRSAAELLQRIKANIAAGLPSLFGLSVYESIHQSRYDGKIPFPSGMEERIGGHAVVAVGFDDKFKIKNAARGSDETVGALKIRNSWGTDWGEDGYGWLPYDYVLSGLTADWWSLLSVEWLDTGEFAL